MKKCPFCAEEIQDEAIKCKYCRSNLVNKTDIVDDLIENVKKYTNEYQMSFIKYPRQYISLAILLIAILFPLQAILDRNDPSPNIVIYRDRTEYYSYCIMGIGKWSKIENIESFEKIIKILISGCLIVVAALTFKAENIDTIKTIVNRMHWAIISLLILFTVAYSMMLTDGYNNTHRFVPIAEQIHGIIVLPFFSFGVGGYMMILSTMFYFTWPIFKKRTWKNK